MGTKGAALPSGMRDFDPQQIQKRLYIIQTIKHIFEKYGYQPIETPAMELLETLLGKYGEEGDKLLYRVLNSGDPFRKFRDPSGRITADDIPVNAICEKGLRYDLTVPFARYLVQHRNEITLPFRRYQIQPVWRADRPQKGRFREFWQCDADIAGTSSLIPESEMILMWDEAFQILGIPVTIRINNRKLLHCFELLPGMAGKFQQIVTGLDKLGKIGRKGVDQELHNSGLTETAPLWTFVDNFFEEKTTHSRLKLIENTFSGNKQVEQGVNEMRTLLDYLEIQPPGFANLQFDITLARGLDYYTGTIFEVEAEGQTIGSIASGGRYDNLTGLFGWEGVSGVGISFGLDRIYEVMEALDLFPGETSRGKQVLFINFGGEYERVAFRLAGELRKAGLQTELFPEPVKLKKQMRYANAYGFVFTVFCGEEELKNNRVVVRHMATGNQEVIETPKLVTYLTSHFNNANA